MKFRDHPIWLVGFRPFFILATLSGMFIPIFWALMFSGVILPPNTSFSLIQWHAHEMFFGFGWALLGGFLLTSTKNWVQIRGYHGRILIFLASTWVIERGILPFEKNIPHTLFLILNNLFLVSIISAILWTLIRHRQTDTYKDNLFLILTLPLFVLSKNLLLNPAYFAFGSSMTLALFRMAFLIMLERTLTQFMQSVFQVKILRNFNLDSAIKTLNCILIFQYALPSLLSKILLLALALLLSYRFIFWKPLLAFKRLDIGIMHLGYLMIIAQIFIELLNLQFGFSWMGAFSVHIFTFGVMGFITPAMIIRISNGHTGRKPQFDFRDRLSLWIMVLAFGVRVLLTQAAPSFYITWIYLAATCWFFAFLLIAIRYIPFLLKPRVDGKEH